MRYIEWVDYNNWVVLVKRASNKKWYNASSLLDQICRFVNQSDRCDLATEFIYEYLEIKKSFQFLAVDFPKHFVLITDPRKFKPKQNDDKKSDNTTDDFSDVDIEKMLLPNF